MYWHTSAKTQNNKKKQFSFLIWTLYKDTRMNRKNTTPSVLQERTISFRNFLYLFNACLLQSSSEERNPSRSLSFADWVFTHSPWVDSMYFKTEKRQEDNSVGERKCLFPQHIQYPHKNVFLSANHCTPPSFGRKQAKVFCIYNLHSLHGFHVFRNSLSLWHTSHNNLVKNGIGISAAEIKHHQNVIKTHKFFLNPRAKMEKMN